MFLTEGTKLNTAPAVSASPTTGWQMLYESEVAWHKLEMGMTRLEHSAIVREDHGLLQEGVKEFFTKAKRWFQWAGQEFLRYIDKVIDTWTNIQNKIRTWLISADSIKKKLEKGKTVTVPNWVPNVLKGAMLIAQRSDKIKNYVDTLRDAADKVDSENEDKGSFSHAMNKDAGRTVGHVSAYTILNVAADTNVTQYLNKQNANNSYGETVPLEKNVLLEMLNFAKDGRIRCIKTLQYMRNSIAKLINSGIRAADAESDEVKSIKKASSKFREVVNTYISLINKATNAVISALGKLRDKAGAEKEAEKKYTGGAGESFFFD